MKFIDAFSSKSMKDLNKGVHISPNIQSDPELYEIENNCCDKEKKIESFIASLLDWKNKRVLDIGCGTGYHLPYFSKKADHVYGVEPHDDSRLIAHERIFKNKLSNISLLKGAAEALALANNSIDLAYARFAYFFGPGCEKGIEEVFRVLRPGGLFVVIDNNLESGEFGPWVKESFKHSDNKQNEIETFWNEKGFKLKTLKSNWSFESRSDLEKVLKIEFYEDTYKKIINNHTGTQIDYTFNLYYKFM